MSERLIHCPFVRRQRMNMSCAFGYLSPFHILKTMSIPKVS